MNHEAERDNGCECRVCVQRRADMKRNMEKFVRDMRWLIRNGLKKAKP